MELSSANFWLRITCTSNKSERDFYLDWVPANVYDDLHTSVHVNSFTACSGRSVAASRGALHLWSWVVVAVLAIGRPIFMKRRQLHWVTLLLRRSPPYRL